jgi:hypothetical protein
MFSVNRAIDVVGNSFRFRTHPFTLASFPIQALSLWKFVADQIKIGDASRQCTRLNKPEHPFRCSNRHV